MGPDRVFTEIKSDWGQTMITHKVIKYSARSHFHGQLNPPFWRGKDRMPATATCPRKAVSRLSLASAF